MQVLLAAEACSKYGLGSTHALSEQSTQRNPQDMITYEVRWLKMAIKRFVEYSKKYRQKNNLAL